MRPGNRTRKFFKSSFSSSEIPNLKHIYNCFIKLKMYFKNRLFLYKYTRKRKITQGVDRIETIFLCIDCVVFLYCNSNKYTKHN